MQFIDGAYNNFSAGLTDIFLAIVDTTANGNFALKYFSYLGGTNDDTPLALEVDSNGVAYLAGSTTSTDFPMAGNSVQTTGAGTAVSGFVAAIDPSLYGGVSPKPVPTITTGSSTGVAPPASPVTGLASARRQAVRAPPACLP